MTLGDEGTTGAVSGATGGTGTVFGAAEGTGTVAGRAGEGSGGMSPIGRSVIVKSRLT